MLGMAVVGNTLVHASSERAVVPTGGPLQYLKHSSHGSHRLVQRRIPMNVDKHPKQAPQALHVSKPESKCSQFNGTTTTSMETEKALPTHAKRSQKNRKYLEDLVNKALFGKVTKDDMANIPSYYKDTNLPKSVVMIHQKKVEPVAWSATAFEKVKQRNPFTLNDASVCLFNTWFRILMEKRKKDIFDILVKEIPSYQGDDQKLLKIVFEAAFFYPIT